jgi:hypothetical protein
MVVKKLFVVVVVVVVVESMWIKLEVANSIFVPHA